MALKRRLTPHRFWFHVGCGFSSWLVITLAAPLTGSNPIDFREIFSDPAGAEALILFQIRLPRVLFAGLVGGGLAMAGVILQAILRNPLASPFTLGVSGGGSLGAVLAIQLGLEGGLWGLSWLPVASFLGSSAIILIVYLLSRSSLQLAPVTLLLAGVVLNFICSAGILLLFFFSSLTESFQMTRWMMGGLDIFGYDPLFNVAPFFLIGVPFLLYLSRYLNVLSAGGEWAASRGLEPERLISHQYFGASLITGSVIAYSGPIGFVGLIVPHALRLIYGPDHRLLLILSLFWGGSFLLLCDTLARLLFAPLELPVGVITALLGGPFFLWILFRRKRIIQF